jgi:hypothetical protein
MKLKGTLKVLRHLSSVSASESEIDDALLVGDIGLVLTVLKMEIRSLTTEENEPRLLLALSKLYQAIGDEPRALATFQRAATYVDQNRGYYTDIGHCSELLCRESASEEFRGEVRSSIQRLLKVCPFGEDLRRALGQT